MMVTLGDILNCPDLLLLVARSLPLETLVELLQVNRSIRATIKLCEHHIYHLFEAESLARLGYLQGVRDETGDHTILGLARLQNIDLKAALSSLNFTFPLHTDVNERRYPFRAAEHLCNILPNDGFRASLTNSETRDGQRQKRPANFTQWDLYRDTSQAMALMRKLSRVADTTRRRVKPDGRYGHWEEAQAILAGRKSVVQDEGSEAISAFYRLRLALLTRYVHGVNVGFRNTRLCSYSALWNYLLPCCRARRCCCTKQVDYLHSFDPRTY